MTVTLFSDRKHQLIFFVDNTIYNFISLGSDTDIIEKREAYHYEFSIFSRFINFNKLLFLMRSIK